MHSIAVVNMKGGVGKTTTAVHVAAGFARRGQAVLLIDADPQGNVAHILNVQSRGTLHDLMLGQAGFDDVAVRDVRPGLDVVTANTSAFELEQRLAGAPQRETILSRRLRGMSGYDVMVLDSSPSMGLLTYNALLCATEVLIPVTMDPMALIGARQTLNGIAEVQELWPERNLTVRALVPVCVNPTTRASRASMDALQRDADFSRHLFRSGIRQCIDLTYAAANRQTIWEYAPSSRAAADYDALVDFLVPPAQASVKIARHA